MKLIFSAISLFFFYSGFSQSWRKIDQTDYNMKYKLPKNWEVDGFGSGFNHWDEGGSSVCSCSGTINFGPDRKLGMVIYPTISTSDLSKREYVWDYHFIPAVSLIYDDYHTKTLEFEKTISKWELETIGSDYSEMLDDEVWKFTAKGLDYGFIIYFWANPDIMIKNKKTIYKILDSFVPVLN